MKGRGSFYCRKADFPVIEHVLLKYAVQSLTATEVPEAEHTVHVTFEARDQKTIGYLHLVVTGVKDALAYVEYEQVGGVQQ